MSSNSHLICVIALFTLTVICGFLIHREFRIRALIGQMIQAASNKTPLFIVKHNYLSRLMRIDELQRAINDMHYEFRKSSQVEKNHLRQIETTLGNIQESVIIVDEANFVLLANQSFHRLIDTRDIKPGQRLENLIQCADFLEYVRSFKQSEFEAPREIQYLKEGSTMWFEVTGALLDDRMEGTDSLYLFVLHDITHQKRLETIRSQFVANVSHELRTPVTIIKGFADTLVEDHIKLSDADRERFLMKIQKNVIRLHRLLEDLLTLTRLETPTSKLNREPLLLGELVREVADNLESQLVENNQTIVIDLDPNEKPVQVDPLRITEVLENIMDNAIRHARGMTQLSVRTRCSDVELTCSIEDNGCGIPEHDLPRIFERFYRVDKGRSRERGGTGLGLSIVKHIIQLHNGTIKAYSGGSINGLHIVFTLPLSPARETNREPPIITLR